MTKKKKIIIGSILAPLLVLAIALAVVWITNPWLIREGMIYAEYVIHGNRSSSGVDARNVKVDGIDVSHHNGWIDWKKVSANKNIKFVYVKATQGVGYQDPMFRRNVKDARNAGFEVGVYHFFTKKSSGKKQFEYFKKTVRHKYIGTIIPMVDVEYVGVGGMGASNLRRELKEFCQLIAKEYGRKPVIYTNSGIYNDWFKGEFDDHYIWISRYGIKPNLKNNAKHNIWQFTEHGCVDGICGYTDLNAFSGDMSIDKLKF